MIEYAVRRASYKTPEIRDDPVDLACAESMFNTLQDVGFDSVIREETQAGRKFELQTIVVPRRIDLLIANIAYLKHQGNHGPLAEQPITPDNFATHVPRGIALTALCDITNYSLGIQTYPPSRYDGLLDLPETGAMDTCSRAETGFALTIAQILTPETPQRNNGTSIGHQIIMDGDKPIMIRKGIGAPSALTLVPIGPYPAGSIVRIRLDGEDEYPPFPRGHTQVAVSEITEFSFERLSAFSEQPGLRELIFHGEFSNNYYNRTLAECGGADTILWGATTGDIQDIIRQSIARGTAYNPGSKQPSYAAPVAA